jgi:transposase-like protein
MTMTTAALLSRPQNGDVADELDAKPTRRRFSAEYKLAILAEYDSLTEHGAKGELLRREGLYAGQLIDWRRQRDEVLARELEPKVRQSKLSPQSREIERLRRENAKLSDQLDRHRKALEIQGKASELLAQLLAESTPETGQQPKQGN